LKRVVHLLGSLKPSGMERMLASSYDDWKKNEWDAQIFSYDSGNIYEYELTNFGYKVVNLPRSTIFRYLLNLFVELRNGEFDVVHLHVESNNGLVSIVIRLALPRATIVRTIHNVFNNVGVARTSRKIQRLMAKVVGTKFVAPGYEVAIHEQKYWNTHTLVIENWVSSEFISKSSEITKNFSSDGDIVFGIVGNCSVIKNHKLALNAIIDLDSVKLIHLGDESGMPTDERALKNVELIQGKVQFLGFVSNVASEMAKIECLLVPSLQEGFSVVVLEALCFGIPILAKKSPGMMWLADTPGTLLIENDADWEQSLRAFDRKLLAQLTGDAEANKENLRRRFSPERGVKQYVDIYQGSI